MHPAHDLPPGLSGPQVNDAVHRVDEMRQTMPGLISAAITKEMEKLRPAVAAASADASELAAGAEAGSSGAADGPAAAELQAMLSDVANRLPALRARVDQTVGRLGRIITAVESEQSRPSPKTVERVVMGRLLVAGPGQEDDVALGISDDAGKALTRRRLAQDLQAGRQ